MASSAMGAITYVDAELGNTTIDGAAAVLGVNCSTDYTNITDNLWGWRTNRTDVNGDGVWVTDGGAAVGEIDRESTAPLKIDITLPDVGVYDLYAVIMNNNSGAGYWDIATRIGNAGVFTVFNKFSEEMTQALATDFEGTVTVSAGTDMTFKVLIGQYAATTANETVSIYINGLDSWDEQAGLDQRTRFDGVGYKRLNGLTTYIYDNTDLRDLKVTRIDSQVNFNWGTGSPDSTVGADTFSVVWEGGITAPQEGQYTFYVNSDDGARLYVNDILIMDQWSNHSLVEYSGTIYLRPGTVYPIRLEYYDNTGSAIVQLLWSGPGVSKQVIPTAYLSSVRTVNSPSDIWVVDLAATTIDYRFLALTLQGLVAKDKPVILAKQGALTGYIRADMELEGTVFHDNTSVLWLLNEFIDQVDGIIVCGSDLASVNAATSLCGPMNAVGVYESILSTVQAQTGLPILADVRGMDELTVYNTYKSLFGKEVLVDVNKIDYLRDISVTRHAFTYYDVDSATRVQFIDGLTSQGTVLGWGSNAEYYWVKDVSLAGAGGVPADWCKNLSTLSKLPTEIPQPPRKYPAPVQEGERIVAFSMSDGDNLQIMAGGFIIDSKFFAHPARGTFPMSWEFPPSMGEFVPRGVRCFYQEASRGENPDCFIAGPSGHGYAFHYYLPDRRTYAANTAQAMKKCRLTVTSMINDNSGSMSDSDQLLERPEILGVAYKDWAPYDRRGGAIYWHNGKPAVSYKCILWDGLGSPEEVAAEIAAMPSSPATNQSSYAMINANAWSFTDIGGPMQAIVNTIALLPENTRLVTVEELIILLRNNFGTPVTEEEYNAM